MKVIILFSLFLNSFVFASSPDLCGKTFESREVSLLKAMNIVEKQLVRKFKADKVFYLCYGDATVDAIRRNNFPHAWDMNIAFIALFEENNKEYIFTILELDSAYPYANYAVVDKKSGKVSVVNL